jgi:hypothetical protein
MRRLHEKMLLAGCIFPFTLFAQHISLNKLLRLQKSSLLQIQDYLETNDWKLKGITTLQDVDSLVFQINIRQFIDSLSSINTHSGNTSNDVVKNTKPDAPAWIDYISETSTKIKGSFVGNSLAIMLPKFYLLKAIRLGLKNYEVCKFDLSIKYGFSDIKIYREIINDIDDLNITPNASYIMYNKPLITRVYKLNDQVINLTTISEKTTSYSLEIFSRSDYDYLHAAEEALKGKNDYVH